MIKYLTKLASFAILTYSALASAGANNVKEYGIVILPETKCATKAAEINSEIAQKLSQLANPYNNWHVTLYHGAFEPHALSKITHALVDLKIQPFNLHFTNIYAKSYRWIDLGMKKSEVLHKLHKKIVSIASKHHVKVLDRARDVYNATSNEKRHQIDEYGVSGVMSLYKPHMSLFYTYPPYPGLTEVAKEIAKMHEGIMVCKASFIAIGELGYNGNIIKILDTINIED